MTTLSTIILGLVLLAFWLARKVCGESRRRQRFDFGPMLRQRKRTPSLFYPSAEASSKVMPVLKRRVA